MKKLEDSVSAFLNNLTTGTPDKIMNLLTDDVEVHLCLGNQLYTDSYAATFIGKAGARNFFSICHNLLDNMAIDPSDIYTEQQKVIFRGDLECRLKINGTRWKCSWMQISSFKENRINKLRIFSDFQAITSAKAPEKGMIENLDVARLPQI
jgi:ketosteroid isomerase-like protein